MYRRARGRAAIVVHDLGTHSERTLEVDGVVGRSIAVSPDGRLVAYRRRDAAEPGERVGLGGDGALVVMELVGGSERVFPLLIRTGTDIMRVPLDGSSPVAIGVQGGPLQVDPSGTRLVFGRAEQQRSELWLLQLGSEP